MTDSTQVLIVAVITVMTVLLTIVGIQLIFILRDVRRLMTKAIVITEEFEKVGHNVGRGYSEIMGFVGGFKKLFFVIDLLSKRKKGKKNDSN